MKTTNFKLSKRLAEIGFKAETSKAIAMLGTKDYPSYDLETILDTLPKQIKGYELCIYFGVSFKQTKFTYNWQMLEVKQNWEESLADCAARLLIKLHEAGLIKFEVKND